MIDDTVVVFPNNIVDLVATRSLLLDTTDPKVLFVTKRPLRESDPSQSIGVFASLWDPDDESLEMRGSPIGPSEPTLQTYRIAVQAFVKDMDEERGLAVHSVLSKMIRSMLYRDDPLRVALSSLSVTMNGSTERTKRWGIRTTRYFSNEIEGSFLYLSVTEFWLETETV